MVTVECGRCHLPVPKSQTRHSKIWGGRICPSCWKIMGEIMELAKRGGYYAPQTVAPKNVEKKSGILSRIAQKLFRRRGVR